MTSDPSEQTAVDPDAILRQPFSTVRKGYDPLEVQKYLMALATELRAGRERERLLERQVSDATKRAAALEHLSPQRLTSMLGEETAKVIDAANTASSDIRTKAEENVARLLRDAQEQANRTRREAEEVLERKTAEAEEASARIRRQAEEVLQQARIDADADAEQGRERGREMVTEAQRVRERMLRDLVRRRKTLRQQIEQLNAGRERLIEAYVVVRETLDTATNELDIVLPEAKVAADIALQRAIESDSATLDEDMAALSIELHEPAMDTAPAAPEPVAADTLDLTEVSEPVPPVDDEVELIEEGGHDDYHEPRAPDPVAGRHSSAVNVIVPSLAEEESEPIPAEDDDEDQVDSAESAAAEPPAPLDDADGLASSSARVAHLFARIKHEAGTDELHGEAAARLIPTDAPPGSDDQLDEDAGELPLAERCALVVRELERSLARHVKRELSDEQNEMLDAVRRDPSAPASQLLVDPEDHVERYVNAASATLSDAALAAGELLPAAARRGPDGPRVGGLARDVAADLAAELVAPLRVRVEASFAEVGRADDPDIDLGETVRADYREWRTQRVDPLVTRAVVTAMNRGVLASLEPDADVHWLVVGTDRACELCGGNADAAAVAAGDAFPSGHVAPPIHDGCRCLLVVDPA